MEKEIHNCHVCGKEKTIKYEKDDDIALCNAFRNSGLVNITYMNLLISTDLNETTQDLPIINIMDEDYTELDFCSIDCLIAFLKTDKFWEAVKKKIKMNNGRYEIVDDDSRIS